MSDNQEAAAAIGAVIRAHRRAKGLSTRDLAARIGTSQPFVSNIENGRIFPSLRTLGLLADALEVPADRLLPAPGRVEGTNLARHPRHDDATPSRSLLAAPDRLLRIVRVELAPGEREPRPHTHAGEEVVRIVRGDARVLRESELPQPIADADAVWLSGDVPHRLEAGADGATALIVLTGADEEAHA